MQSKATITSQSLHYLPKKKSRLAYGGNIICSTLIYQIADSTVYGLGNAFRKFLAIFRLLADCANDFASSVFHALNLNGTVFIKMEKFIPTVCIPFCGRNLLSDMGKKGAKTKEAIRRQAYRLFAEKGFKAVTMTDICEKTGLSRGGLYRYYSGTEEIFSEILSEEYVIADRIEKKEKASAILEDMLEVFIFISHK